MKNIRFGIISGIAFGIFSVLIMLPISFPDKTAALTGAFINRFAIGFLISVSILPMPSWIKGLIIGVLLSLPDAIITKSYAPILVFGALGGLVIGYLVERTDKGHKKYV